MTEDMTQNAIEIENFSFGYDRGCDVLRDINLSIKPGQKVALIGCNGAGKSTLLLAMNMFVKGRGRITIDGICTTATTATTAGNAGKTSKAGKVRAIRQTMGLVLQDPNEQLFMPTLYDDVAFGPMNLGLDDDSIEKRTHQALRTVGLEGMDRRAPYHLSAGQKRAAAIATILAMEPKIITMDEPDTSLDPRSRNRLIELLNSLDHTLVIATCSMNFAACVCGRAVLMDDGRIVADGATNKIMGDAELMERHGLETPTRWNDNTSGR